MLRAGRDEQRGGRIPTIAERGGSRQDRFMWIDVFGFSCTGRSRKTDDHALGAWRRRRPVQRQWDGALVLGLFQR